MPVWRAAELVKSPGQLPLVDPDFLLVERRPEKLHAYARGLLWHLRHIRAGGKAGGYPIATIKAAAVWLIESYSEALVAPAPEGGHTGQRDRAPASRHEHLACSPLE
jgi:hypothetical protein